MLEPVNRPQYDDQIARSVSGELVNIFQKRRTTRMFQPHPVSLEVILNAVSVAATAPSGANRQPWSFVVVGDQATKDLIRTEAEKEETKFYHQTGPKKWIDDLKHLHTSENKSFISDASYLIPVFSQNHSIDEDCNRQNNYYVKESVGLATGFLISSLHLSGLSVLTYTPSNRNFLVNLLGRPKHEKTFMVLVVGVASDALHTPVISKKSLDSVVSVFKGVQPRLPEPSFEVTL